MSKLTKLLTATALISAVSFTAFANSPLLDKADENGDGLIQLSEFTALGDQKFANMDANNNGLVTPEEHEAFRKLMRETRAREKFAAADTNNDGQLSETEFMAKRDERMERMQERRDMNGDGQVNKEDRKARRKMFKERRKEMRGQMGGRPEIDTNGDGAVDLAEHQAATKARFEHMDKNGDGVLDADEQKPPRGPRGPRGQHGEHPHGQNQHGMRR